jgi:heat shock protein HslJ
MRARNLLATILLCILLLGETGMADIAVTESDLQHHRWVLESIDGEALQLENTESQLPDLDFGEQMHVSGNTGCNQYSGKAVLRDGFFLIESMIATQRSCSAQQNDIELKLQTVLGHESAISLGPNGSLTLRSASSLLVFRLQDWKQ